MAFRCSPRATNEMLKWWPRSSSWHSLPPKYPPTPPTPMIAMFVVPTEPQPTIERLKAKARIRPGVDGALCGFGALLGERRLHALAPKLKHAAQDLFQILVGHGFDEVGAGPKFVGRFYVLFLGGRTEHN